MVLAVVKYSTSAGEYLEGWPLVVHVIYYKTYYLPVKRLLEPGTDAGVDKIGGGGS